MTPPRGSPEKAIQATAEKLMGLFGYAVYHLSQARATQQTPGLPDDIFIGHRTIVFYECKAPGGKQSVHQKAFQRLVESSGETYLVGGIDQLEQYLITVGLARRVPGGIEGVRRSA